MRRAAAASPARSPIELAVPVVLVTTLLIVGVELLLGRSSDDPTLIAARSLATISIAWMLVYSCVRFSESQRRHRVRTSAPVFVANVASGLLGFVLILDVVVSAMLGTN